MQVFNLFFRVTRSKLGVGILYTVIFFAICFPMVNASEKKVDFEDTSLELYIRDDDRTEASRALVEALGEKHSIHEDPMDNRQLMDAMYYSAIDYSLVIPEGYAEHLASLDSEALGTELLEEFHLRDSYAAAMMSVWLNEYFRNARVALAAGDDLAAAVRKAAERPAVDVEMVRDPEEEAADADFTPKFAWFFRLLLYILIAVIVSMLGPILISLNREDQRKRIECSRLKVSSYVTQVFMGSAVLVAAVWLVFMAGGAVMYGGMYAGVNSRMAVLNSLIFALLAAMFTIFISTFRPSDTVMSMIAQAVGLGMAFLCGGFVPQSLLGSGVLAVARVLPGFWYEKANDILCGDQAGTMGDVWTCFAVQGGFILLFLALTILMSARHPKAKSRK